MSIEKESEYVPKVSIVIPIYNVEKYLVTCLDSVVAQTVTSYETIMVDDGSTDGSGNIAKKYCKDRRFQYVFQENSGVSTARNFGLSIAKGEWIAFLDSDDSLHRTYLEELLQEADDDCDIVCCGAEYMEKGTFHQIHFDDQNTFFMDEKGLIEQDKYERKRRNCTVSTFYNFKGKKELYAQLMCSQYGALEPRKTAIGVPWGKIYRASLLKENGLVFHVKLKRLQDNIFNMYAFDKARVIKYIDRPLYVYNLDHIKGISRRYDPKAPDYYNLICHLRREFLDKHNLLKDSKLFQLYCQEVARFIDNMLCQYYLNLKNEMEQSEVAMRIEEQFADPLYQEALKEKCVWKTKIGRKLRLKLLAKEKYHLLVLSGRLIQTKRIVESVLYRN